MTLKNTARDVRIEQTFEVKAVNLVMVAKTRVMTCEICGGRITEGEVYVLLYAENERGQLGWKTVHLECDARRRGAQKVRLRSLPMVRTKDGLAVKKGDDKGT